MTHKNLIHTFDIKPVKICVTGVNGLPYTVPCLNVALKNQNNETFVHNLDETTAYRLHKQLDQHFKTVLKNETSTTDISLHA